MDSSEIKRTILYALYLPFVVLMLFICKQVWESDIAKMFDVFFNPDVVVIEELEDGELVEGIIFFFVLIFLPLDLHFLKIIDVVDVKSFLLVFSIPVVINTTALIMGCISVIKNFGAAEIVPAITLGLSIHLIRVINLYIHVLGVSNCYLNVSWMTLGFLGGNMWVTVIFFGMIVGFILALMFPKRFERRRCPICKSWVQGKRWSEETERRTYTDTWTSNDKVGELRDEKGNSIDIYKKVEHSRDSEYVSYKYGYHFSCPHCGESWDIID